MSSCNWLNIKEQLERAEQKMRLYLKLNLKSISASVSIYIQQKTQQLAYEKNYNIRTHKVMLQHLILNANNIFL